MTTLARPLDASPVSAKTWFGFVIMCLGMFMAILDVQIVATSLPTIQLALKLRPDEISWVQSAYLTSEIVAIPLTGLFSRALTMRWLFVSAITVFTFSSIGCAFSSSFAPLVLFRIVQGFSGGMLIPAVFAAVFIFFPTKSEGVATTMAGVLAVLAPTLGPIVGGWITQTYSWRWLFLINVLPGLIAVVGAVWTLPQSRPQTKILSSLDLVALICGASALVAVELALKAAPEQGWLSAYVLVLFASAILLLIAFVIRSLRSTAPIVDLAAFRDRNFTVGCMLSFALGAGLFGSVYLMPVFLGFVRGYGPLSIGQVMVVTGAAQLAMAPVVVALERRAGARLLTLAGFAAFAAGLGLSALQTPASGFRDLFLPQVIRGAAIMFCLLPPTRLALSHQQAAIVADASGLFNLMRNLGGAIGLAVIDTVIFARSPKHAAVIGAQLQAGDESVARNLGIPIALFHANMHHPATAQMIGYVRPLIQRLSLTQAINDAWLLLALVSVAALVSVSFAKAPLK